MNILHRIFRVTPPNVAAEGGDPGFDERMQEREAELENVRAELRQKVQRTQSGARVLKTWAGAMEMIRSGEREQPI